MAIFKPRHVNRRLVHIPSPSKQATPCSRRAYRSARSWRHPHLLAAEVRVNPRLELEEERVGLGG